MQMVVLLFVSTLGLALFMKFVITPKLGQDVSSRFIERLNYIPSQKPHLLDRQALSDWIVDRRNKDALAGYVSPVLFPLDILFLVSLGLLFGFSSIALAANFDFLSNVPGWVWWVFPGAYMLSDLFEDITVAALFKAYLPVTDRSYFALRAITRIKIATVSMAIGQVGFLTALWAVLHFFPATR